ncbi:MAG: 5-N-acetyl-7-N-(D-alanyl)-legionaminic acid cytidylyltransferase [Gaiellaceae bacterium]|jgi:CMP-N-acetylneuraminic acid synthetase|nr:5-N-acetyl-7-N-(D-alanyl)-legionaminic acid cytidylyltransferase [Gaiellaceae bacterium]
MTLRTLAVVPARGGSTRVPGKNLALLEGRTLVRRALETAVAAGCFTVVALSSDSDEILAEAAGLEVTPVKRPPELATSTARAFDVVLHALDELDSAGNAFDAVAVVQCTSPFTSAADLRGAVELLEQSGADSVVSVARIDAAIHPLKLKILDGDRLRPYLEDDGLTPSHDLPPLWARNGSIYVSRRSVLLSGELVGGDLRGFEMPAERSLDIDTPRDLALARLLLEPPERARSAPSS